MAVALVADIRPRSKSPEAFRTISEVASELDVPQHVLRFWESRFAQIKPVKRAGGRRYYRPEDVDLLRGIRSLLYHDGFTIKGVQKVLRDRGTRYVIKIGQGEAVHLSAAEVEESDTAAEVLEVPQYARAAIATLERAHAVQSEPVAAVPVAANGGRREKLEGILTELLALKTRLRAPL